MNSCIFQTATQNMHSKTFQITNTAENVNVRWFALQVRPRHEKAVASILHDQGYDDFLPLYKCRHRWSDRYKQVELPLFPGYLFCRFDLRHRLPILMNPSVVRIVGSSQSSIPLDDAEIYALQAIVNSGLNAQPWPFLQVGQLVRIEEGSLCGLEGILLDCRKDLRLVVSVQLLQRSVAVEIDSHWVSPVKVAGRTTPSSYTASVLVSKAASA